MMNHVAPAQRPNDALVNSGGHLDPTRRSVVEKLFTPRRHDIDLRVGFGIGDLAFDTIDCADVVAIHSQDELDRDTG